MTPSDVDPSAPKQWGELVKAMYRTRHAAVAGQAEVQKAIRDGRDRHGVRGVLMLVPSQGGGAAALAHGDEFLITARRDIAEELTSALAWRCQIECVTVGPREDDEKELLILNRKVRWTRGGEENSVDPKHTKVLVEEWLEHGAPSQDAGSDGRSWGPNPRRASARPGRLRGGGRSRRRTCSRAPARPGRPLRGTSI